jgi:hypothetical protein
MKLLTQPTDYTCGQTSVAMVADVSIEQVLKIMKSGKTTTKDLVRALRILGVRSRRRLRRREEGVSLPKFCILHLVATGQHWGHWAVCYNSQVYDPSWGMNPEWPTGVHVSSYLEILK